MIDKTSLLEIYHHLAHLTNLLFAAQQGRGGDLPALYHPQFNAENVTQITPYTVETRLGSIPYTEAYHSILQEVIMTCQTLIHHHETLGDPHGVKFLHACIEACQSNDRDTLETVRLQCYGNADSTISYCPSRGPVESYNDLVLHRKKIFECSLMTIDRHTTSFIQNAIDCHLPDFVRNGDYFSNHPTAGVLPPQVTTLVGELTLTGGDFVQLQPSGRSRPTDPEMLMRAGSIKQIFLNQLTTKTQTLYIPLAQKLFQTDRHVVLELFATMPRLHVVLHEHGHTIGKLPDYPTRAGRRYTMIEEIRADFVAIALSLYLEKNNHLPTGTSRALIGVMLVCELFMRSRFDHTQTTTRERESYSRNAPALVRVFSEIFLIETRSVVLKSISVEALHALFSPRFLELQQLIANGQEQDMEVFLVGLEQQRRHEQTEVKGIYTKHVLEYIQ